MKPHGNPWVCLILLHFLSLSLGVCLSNPNEAPPDQNSFILGARGLVARTDYLAIQNISYIENPRNLYAKICEQKMFGFSITQKLHVKLSSP